METFSALLAIYAGNSLVPGEFPTQKPGTRSFDVFFDLRMNKRLSKQSWGWWFEMLLRPLWRQCNEKSNRYLNLNYQNNRFESSWDHTIRCLRDIKTGPCCVCFQCMRKTCRRSMSPWAITNCAPPAVPGEPRIMTLPANIPILYTEPISPRITDCDSSLWAYCFCLNKNWNEMMIEIDLCMLKHLSSRGMGGI